MPVIPNDDTGDALRRFAEDGSDLKKPMKIDFFVTVPSKEAGDQMAPRIQSLGFKTSVEQDCETSDWTCYCTKTLVPDYSAIVQIEQQLDLIAKPFDGYVDGFGSYGNANC